MNVRPLQKLLVANRGEIALRILRSAREMGISTVAVYSEADADGPWIDAADMAVCIGPAASAASYLNTAALLAAAASTGADAIHPGYGFLSENADFAQAVIDAGLCWVGPAPQSIAAMGDKIAARRIARQAKVPTVPGVESSDLAEIAQVGFPLLLKAAGGGGGKGMRVVESASELLDAFTSAQAEAQNAFGNPTVYAERLLQQARHVEVQLLGDAHGNCIHLYERDCSLQRRHQKVIEEAPAPGLSEATRTGLQQAALALAAAVQYQSAGTVEFLVLPTGEFFFLEMNTRIQVEHTITEAICGVDLVQEQLRIAMGFPLRYQQGDIHVQGHAIQARLYAEDPANGYLPSPGLLSAWRVAEGPGVRIDSGVRQGSTISVWYDPLLAKLIAWGPDREAARARLVRILEETVVMGIQNNAEFLQDVLEHPDFVTPKLHTAFLSEHFNQWQPPAQDPLPFLAAFIASTMVKPSATTVNAPTGPWQGLGPWSLV